MIIIPARLNSSRFANKVLVDILGTPMVIKTAQRVSELDDVLIASDSQEVLSLAKKYNIKSILTSSKHSSGTDRINEATNILGLSDDEIVVNVQADEPFIEPSVVKSVIERLKETKDNNDILLVSAYKKIPANLAEDINHVKVVLDKNQNALYFSRNKVPFYKDPYQDSTFNGHLGIYAFYKKNLNTFCALEEAPLERIEKLEQLRALYNAKKIAMVEVQSKSFGIDTKEDLENALAIFG